MESRVERVLERLGIEAKRHGQHEWIALCPNPDHDDRHPSWRIRDDDTDERNGQHNCFSCGFGGDLVALVAGCNFLRRKDAEEWLASPELAEAIPADVVVVSVATEAYRRFAVPRGVVVAPLHEWLTSPRRYAVRRRLTPAQVDRWGLGYAITGRLAGRIFVPWARVDGVPRYYTARDYYGTAPRKYLQPEKSERPDRTVMFGERYWTSGTVVVTEGELNALAIERAFPDLSVAAIAGSEISPVHLAKIAGRFDTVVMATDPDVTGSKVSKVFARMVKRHATVKQAKFPNGLDVCDLESTQGIEAVRHVLQSAKEEEDDD